MRRGGKEGVRRKSELERGGEEDGGRRGRG